jgi:uncharacterized protein involved in cysteine biosynthesis
MRWLRRLLYWLAVVAVAAVLAFLLIRLAERLDASQIGAVAEAPIQGRASWPAGVV